MSKSAIDTMLDSPSVSIKVLASLGKALLEHEDYTIVCSMCEKLHGIYEPAVFATTLAGWVRDDVDPDYEIQVYHVLAMCNRHALVNLEDIERLPNQ